MKKVLCLLMAIMLVVLSVPALASVDIRGIQAGDVLYIDTPNTKSLNLREAGNSSAKVLKQVPNGTSVIAGASYSGNYLQVTLASGNKESGWMDMRFLSVNPPKVNPTPAEPTGEVVKDMDFRAFKLPGTYMYVVSKPSRAGGYVNLRWVPSTDSAVISKMYAGEEMRVITVGKTWYQVMSADGHVGFIMKKFTEVTYNSTTPRTAIDLTK